MTGDLWHPLNVLVYACAVLVNGCDMLVMTFGDI